jgi:3-oxoacyl-[acyl-carrier-protein] synthase-3
LTGGLAPAIMGSLFPKCPRPRAAKRALIEEMKTPRTSFSNVAIEAVAYELPPVSVTSAQLEERLRTAMLRLKIPPRPIEALTGIAERRFWDTGTRVHDVAARVARRALSAALVPPRAIGLLINTSVCKDYLEPSMASLVHGDLGLPPECGNFDIANACLGFLNGIEVAGRMIEAGQIDYALIVDGESSGHIVDTTIRRLLEPGATAKDFWDNFATLTLGSAAVAMVLAHAGLSRTSHRVNGSVSLCDTTQNRLCLGTAERMVTESTRLLKAGVDLAARTFRVATGVHPRWSAQTIDQFICHQVGRPHMTAIAQALGIDLAKCFPSYPFHGNVGPAAVPLTLALAEEAGRVKEGDHVALMGIGSGLNVTMMSVTW